MKALAAFVLICVGSGCVTDEYGQSPDETLEKGIEQATQDDRTIMRLPVPVSGQAHPPGSGPGVCYEIQDMNQDWFPEACNGELAETQNGIIGLSVDLRNTSRHVHYQAYYDGRWRPEGKDGEKIGDQANTFTAVRILLAPRGSAHICYDVIDTANHEFHKCDNNVAGNMTDAIRSIKIRYRP